MDTGRKLTDDEKRKVHDYALPKAQAAYPDAHVTVIVDDHLDEDGRTNWRILATSTKGIPNA